MYEITLTFSLLLILVAFLYSAIGHGGASGYLALMLLYDFPTELMRATALILNIFISLVSFYQYYNAARFNWKLFFSLTVASVPAAFIGGSIYLESGVYKKILAVILVFSVVRILWKTKDDQQTVDPGYATALLMGAGIGLISGLIGIGGGIILTPILLLLSWTTIKESAAISALFITVNSIAGLAGTTKANLHLLDGQTMMLVLIALIGGALGAYYGSKHFNTPVLKMFLAIVLFIASFKLFMS